jgi:hypothetical protein
MTGGNGFIVRRLSILSNPDCNETESTEPACIGIFIRKNKHNKKRILNWRIKEYGGNCTLLKKMVRRQSGRRSFVPLQNTINNNYKKVKTVMPIL